MNKSALRSYSWRPCINLNSPTFAMNAQSAFIVGQVRLVNPKSSPFERLDLDNRRKAPIFKVRA